jgi:Putative MetA-pathway of phenol degradation
VHYGVLDNLDVGVIVPYVRVDATGTSRLFAENGQELQRVGLRAANSGVGDVAFSGKYRFADFGPPPAAGDTWNASLAAALVVRFPTGDPDDLLGLGVARVLPTFIASGTIGRVSPHLNLGYEFWSDAIETPHDFQERTATVSIKDQVYYNAGFEYELHPRLTVLVDVLGRYLRGGGRVGYQPYFFPSNRLDVTGADALVSIPSGFHTVTLAPGVKWNVYGAALLAAHVLIAATDGGLRDRVTPVIGIDWGF